MTSSRTPVILLAAGGTGGHLFPAEALAGELTARGVVIHLATDHRGMTYGGAFPAVARHEIQAATPSGKSPLSLLKAIFVLLRGTLQSYLLIKKIKPDAVIGFGGYPSVPPVIGAVLAGVPTFIHEQNGVVGRANRFVAPFVHAIATGFEKPKGLSQKNAAKAHHVGNPIRPLAREAMAIPYPALQSQSEIHLLVTGGSQGARVMSTVVPEAIALLSDDIKSRLRITHQARGDDVETAKALYDRAGVSVDIRSFFDDLPMRIAQAQLVIGRAGASTIAELAVIGRPSILVPLPGSLDQDQAANAESLARRGAALVIKQSEFFATALAHHLNELIAHPDRLTDSSRAAKSAGIADAAERFAALIGESLGLDFSRGRSS